MNFGKILAASLVATTACLLAAPSAFGEAKATSYSFVSPSGNISCVMDAAGNDFRVACGTNSSPPTDVVLYPNGRVTTNHNGGNAGEAHTLPYDHYVTLSVFRCDSMTSGVKCTTSRNGRGFILSENGVQLVGSKPITGLSTVPSQKAAFKIMSQTIAQYHIGVAFSGGFGAQSCTKPNAATGQVYCEGKLRGGGSCSINIQDDHPQKLGEMQCIRGPYGSQWIWDTFYRYNGFRIIWSKPLIKGSLT